MKKTATILIFAIIVGHLIGYHYDKFGWDQLIPCLIGYAAIWVIFMTAEFGDAVNEPISDAANDAVKQQNKKVLICNNCKEFWLAPKERCDCGSTTLTETHPYNYKFVKNVDIQ